MHDMENAKPTSPLPPEYHEALRETKATLKHIDRLQAIGQWRLRKLRRALRSAEERLSREISSLYTEQHFVATLTPDVIKHFGEHAVDTEVLNPGVYPASPRTVGYQYIRFGHSSFVRCGSCKHFAVRGELVKCKILSAVYPEQSAPYSSPCLLRLMTDEQLQGLRDDFHRAVERAKKAREVVRTHQKALASLITDEVFPVMINNNYGLETDRKFCYGDRVRVFVRAKACQERARFTWQPATMLSPKQPHVVCLDYGVIHPGKRTDDVRVVTWPKHIMILDSGEYELLHEWEYQWLRERYRKNPDDPFLAEWRSHFDFEMGSQFDRIDSRGPYWEFPAVRIVDELFTGKEVRPASAKQRLMSAEEAMQLLSVSPETLADKKAAERVVAKFYDALHATPQQATLLQRAKATLLLRIEGSQWLGD